MERVTFYCYANKTRSPGMKAYADFLKPEGYDVVTDSAGVSRRTMERLQGASRTRASSWLVRKMESRGILQIRGHVPKLATPELVADSKWNLAATRMVRDKLLELYPEHGDIILTLKGFLGYGEGDDPALDIRDPCTPEGNSSDWYVQGKVMKDTEEAQDMFLEEVERLIREFWSKYMPGL